jgi:hypothetical protein
MLNQTLAVLLVSSLGLAACDMTPDQQRMATGAAIGGGLGLLTAEVLGADTEWVIVSTLAGAAVGTLVARNTATGQCAYSNGDGTYYQAPCP